MFAKYCCFFANAVNPVLPNNPFADNPIIANQLLFNCILQFGREIEQDRNLLTSAMFFPISRAQQRKLIGQYTLHAIGQKADWLSNFACNWSESCMEQDVKTFDNTTFIHIVKLLQTTVFSWYMHNITVYKLLLVITCPDSW